MKIAIIGKFTSEEMGYHISYTLKKMGNEVYNIEYGPKIYADKKFLRKYRIYKRKLFEILNSSNKNMRLIMFKNTIKRIKEIGHIDLIITTYDYLTYDELYEIKKYSKSKIVMWFPDAVSNLGRAYFMTAGYDFIFFKDPYIVSSLKNYYDFKNVYYLPEAFNPDLHNIKENIEKDKMKYECDVSIVANLHSFRVPILEKLIQSNYSIKIFGSPPPFYVNISKNLLKNYKNDYLIYEEKAKACKYAKISLNTTHPAEIEGFNVRVFEITGAGGFLLTPYRKALEDLFKIGEEIEVYNSYSEMLEKIDFYIKNPIKREEIRKKGQIRALENHTYEKRLNKMFDIIYNGADFE